MQLSDAERHYHLAQWDLPKESTKTFASFIAEKMESTSEVADLCCGGGAPTAYLAARFPMAKFLGLDLNDGLIHDAKAKEGVPNLSFGVMDATAPKGVLSDGVVSMHSISWFPRFEMLLGPVLELIKPKWAAFSSLFYEGDISSVNVVTEHTTGREMYYNVYALPAISRFCEERGYELTRAEPFDISFDLERDNPDVMGTYTEVLSSGRRLQISGPLLMPWYNVLIERK